MLWLLLVVTLLLAACGRGSSQPAPSPSPDSETPTRAAEARPSPASTVSPVPETTPTPLPAGPPDEAVLALNALLDEEGRLPLERALAIFAAHVGPLPGVTPRPLPGENAGRVAEAAVITVAAQRDSLPPEVAAAVEDALFGGYPRVGRDPAEWGGAERRRWDRAAGGLDRAASAGGKGARSSEASDRRGAGADRGAGRRALEGAGARGDRRQDHCNRSGGR